MGIPSGGVAFFDSGIGGLTVLAECKKFLPDRLFYYYGDNENAPYGNRKKETIEKYVLTAFERLRELAPQAAVVACNTATAVCVEKLRKIYSFPIVGAEPAVFAAAKRGGEIYVLATKAT
ncbi:MAG: aspartate/glutamate racemase family protein [Clostridia bacterium]|nr:aspartate/glutamate racemase family protein [Clostridia bacterium]